MAKKHENIMSNYTDEQLLDKFESESVKVAGGDAPCLMFNMCRDEILRRMGGHGSSKE